MDQAITSPPPTSSDSSESGEGGKELCASAESVSVDGVAPATGDTVSAKVEGTVDRVEGDHVYISVTKVNGQDVPSDSADNTPADSEGALMDKAKALDSQAYA